MKKRFLLSLYTILILSTLTAQTNTIVRYLDVESDKNIRQNTDQKLCLSCSDNNLIIDGDESLGIIELEFSGINSFGLAKEVYLIMNVANVEYAESGSGFKVFLNNEEVGNISRVNRNTSFVIKLNASKINKLESVKLVLKTAGSDGLYLLSKKSGFGAILRLDY